MSREIEIVRARNNVAPDGLRITPTEVFDSLIHSSYDRGWDFGTGDPEMWRFQDRLLVPGGKVLDLGIGMGRMSTFFALQGMSVTGYDTNPINIEVLRSMVDAYNLPIQVREEDFIEADFGRDVFDTVLIGQSLVHSPSKAAAHSVIGKAIDSVKPGGHLWFRSAGKLDSSYDELVGYSRIFAEITQLDEDTFEAPCSCSGEVKLEPQLYLDPMETLAFFAGRGMNLVHTQVLPEAWSKNIMYGEDWNPNHPESEVGGMITIIAQKQK